MLEASTFVGLRFVDIEARIIDAYRNTEWLPSHNFVLASSRHRR
jgi:hypothetical protein